MVSKIGKNPITIPSGVTVELREGEVVVSGPKGALSVLIPQSIKVQSDGSTAKVSTDSEEKMTAALTGLFRTLIANAVQGVTAGWSKSLELVGTGYRATLTGENLTLAVGFSHPVVIKPPDGIKLEVENNKVTVLGINKQIVGKVAADIRNVRPPEPYKGKGIKYLDEKIRRKAGKAAKAASGAAGAK